MPWLIPSVIAAMTGTIILTYVYFYLYYQDRQRFLYIWGIGWSFYALRFILMLFSLHRPSALLNIGYLLAALVSGAFLLWGTYIFLGKKLTPLWLYITSAVGIWTAASEGMGLSFFAKTFPPFVFLALIYISTGVAILRHLEGNGIGRRLTGWAFILWGIHKGNYPFLRPVEWFAPWGYLIGAALELVVAIGILLVYFQLTKKALTEKEKQFRLFAENAQDIIYRYRLKPEPGFDYVSPSVSAITGYTPEEHYSDPELGMKIVHPDDRRLLIRAMKSPDTNPTLVLRWRHKDRRLVWTEQRNVPVFDDDGKMIAVEGIARDITGHKLAEERLRLSEARLEEAQRVAHLGNYSFEVPDGEVIWSAETFRIFGRDESLKEPSVSEFMTLVHPEDRQLVDLTVEQTVKEKSPFDIEYRILLPDGRLRYIHSIGRPVLDSAGECRKIFGTVMDITDRRKSEEQILKLSQFLSMVIESTNLWLDVLDARGNVIVWNKAAEIMSGYTREEATGKNKIWELLYPDEAYRGEIIGKVNAIIRKDETVEDFETAIRTKSGEQKIISWHSKSLLNEQGESVGSVAIGRDVTEHRRLEEQLRQAQKMEAVGQLAGGVAHDFNNILSAVIGYSHILLEKMGQDDPLRVNVEQILDAAEKAADVSHSLLAFSRKQVINLKPVDMNGIIRKMDKFLSRIIGEDIELKTVIKTGDLRVMADSGQMEQVLMNLAANARDAMPRGGVLTLTSERAGLDDAFISAHGYGERGEYALVSITDTGAGMDAETRRKIFEPFFTTKDTGKGTGLGLAMVYGIVKQHNGFINVYSEPGRGTTFKIYIPLVSETATEYEKKQAVTAAPARGTETVLVAEDDAALRKLSEIVLSEFGYKVILAADGEEAVKRFRENADHIDLLILDMIMPKKNGREAYEEIIKIRPEIRALFVSGYTAGTYQTKELLDRGLTLLLKPVSPKDLLRKVREALDER
jgi:PAS domain S-box-containing protein